MPPFFRLDLGFLDFRIFPRLFFCRLLLRTLPLFCSEARQGNFQRLFFVPPPSLLFVSFPLFFEPAFQLFLLGGFFFCGRAFSAPYFLPLYLLWRFLWASRGARNDSWGAPSPRPVLLNLSFKEVSSQLFSLPFLLRNLGRFLDETDPMEKVFCPFSHS